MNTLVLLVLTCFVGQSVGVFQCDDNLRFYRCSSYKSENGKATKKTCAYPKGDSSVTYDCNATPIICICPEGMTFRDADSKECVEHCDTTPPTTTCPDVHVSAPSDGFRKAIDYTATCEDDSGSSTFTCDPPSGTVFKIGSPENVYCSCVDPSGNVGSCSFQVTVNDTTPPNIYCPLDMNFDAPNDKDSRGYKYDNLPTCTDNSGEVIKAACTPEDESVFYIGSNEVTCSCSDSAGNEANCTFTLTVKDTTDPIITCVDPEIKYVSLETYLAFVDWENPKCFDNSGSNLNIYCDGDFGDRKIGTYEISCTCADEAGNDDSCVITAEVDGETHVTCPEKEDQTFTLDIHDPYDPASISAKLRLPEVGTYKISVTATPIDGTEGKEVSCVYDIDVTEA